MKKLSTIATITAGFLLIVPALGTAQEKTGEKVGAKAQVKTELKAGGKVKKNEVRTASEFRRHNRLGFIDENGDGINDRAKDADGDGIPNGQDPDWVKPGDGTGYKEQHQAGPGNGKSAIKAQGKGKGSMNRSGLSKGSFRSGMSGAAKASGTGVCDGTGPKGSANRKGKR